MGSLCSRYWVAVAPVILFGFGLTLLGRCRSRYFVRIAHVFPLHYLPFTFKSPPNNGAKRPMTGEAPVTCAAPNYGRRPNNVRSTITSPSNGNHGPSLFIHFLNSRIAKFGNPTALGVFCGDCSFDNWNDIFSISFSCL